MELLSVLEPHLGLILWQLIVLSVIIVTVIAIVDIAQNKFENNQKLIWLLICFFVPFGCLIYFFIGRKQRVKSV
jgi:hypothetical protein